MAESPSRKWVRAERLIVAAARLQAEAAELRRATVRAMIADGLTQRQVAAELRISQPRVNQLSQGH